MDQIRNYLNQTIADEGQLKVHYLQIAHNQQTAGNTNGWAQNTVYAFFVQNLIDNLEKVKSMLPEPREVEDQAWC